VLLDPEEIESVKLESRKTLDLVQFVDSSDIDAMYYEKPYYVVPADDLAEEAFVVLRDALRAAKGGSVGIRLNTRRAGLAGELERAFVAEVAERSSAEGLSPLEAAVKNRDHPYREWAETERFVGNLHRAYSELAGNPLDTRLTVPAVWPDMVSFHGGPIACHA
jgi:hypothetical protein